MTRLLVLLPVGLVVGACAVLPPPVPSGAIPIRADVYVQPLAPDVWRHVSYRRFPGAGLIPSNGLIVSGSMGALVIDTAWNPEQTAHLLDWVESTIGPVEAVVVTHAHDDRVGGIAEVHRRGIPSYALAETVRRVSLQGGSAIDHVLASGARLEPFGIAGEVFFPGAAHTSDNAIVWIESQRVLVGGCMIRAQAATTMGNTKEADLEAWSHSVSVLQSRYPEPEIVVPGHGAPAGPELLSHTRALLDN